MQTSLAQIKLCKDPCGKLLPDRKVQKLGKKLYTLAMTRTAEPH